MSNSNSEKDGNRSTRSRGSVWTVFDLPRLQPVATETLRRALRHDRIAPAWLFSGALGTGQWPAALWMTALLNCTGDAATPDIFASAAGTAIATDQERPCGRCPSCRQSAAVSHPALLPVLPLWSTKNKEEYLDALADAIEQRRAHPFALRVHPKAISISIEAIRNLRRRLAVSADERSYRVVILDEVERSRHDALDALLKLIEEPPRQTIFILTTANSGALPRTILSRVRRMSLQPFADARVDEYLTAAGAESAEERADITLWSRGSVGIADSLRLSGELSAQARESARQTMLHLFDREPGQLFALISQLFPEFTSPESSRQAAADYLRYLQIMMNQMIHAPSSIDPVGRGHLTDALHDPWRGRRLLALLENTLDDLRRNVHIRTMIFAFVSQLREMLLPSIVSNFHGRQIGSGRSPGQIQTGPRR